MGGIELFCVKILGMNFGGYTINQMNMMNKYERLLIELGENSYSSIGSTWSVEARIIFMTLFNALIFFIIKLLSSYMPGIGSILPQIANAFLNQEDPNEHIKRAQGMPMYTEEGVPDVPQSTGGFDFGSIINGLSGMFGGNNNNNNNSRRPRASRQPTFTE